MYPGHTSYVQVNFNNATSSPHGYLLLGFRQESPDQLRLWSNIFQQNPQVVYVPK